MAVRLIRSLISVTLVVPLPTGREKVGDPTDRIMSGGFFTFFLLFVIARAFVRLRVFLLLEGTCGDNDITRFQIRLLQILEGLMQFVLLFLPALLTRRRGEL